MTKNKLALGVLAGAAALGLNGPATTQQVSALPASSEIAISGFSAASQPVFAAASAPAPFAAVLGAPGPSAGDLFTTAPLKLTAGGQSWSVGYRSQSRAAAPASFARSNPRWPAVTGAPQASRGDGGSGALSLAYQTSSWHLGAELQASAPGEKALAMDRQSYGVEAFAAFAPPGGLRILAATVGSASESGPAPGALGLGALEPKREVKSYGKSVQLGWEIEVAGASSLMPFARVDAFDTTLAPYAEARGPLPPEYYQIEDHVRVARIGIEGAAYATDNFRLWLRGNWGHRTDGNLVENTGKLFSFYTGFADPGLGASRDWGEAGFGLGWRIQPGMTINASVGGASDGDQNPTVSGAFGLNWRL